MLAARIAVLVEIGQHVNLGMLFVAVVLAEHMDLNFAEIAREFDLCRRRQVDVAEQDQLIIEERLVDLGKHRGRYRLGQRNPPDLAAERWVKGADLEGPIAETAL